MTQPRTSAELTQDEWDELRAIFWQIKANGVASSTTEEMERFTDLFSRSIAEKTGVEPATGPLDDSR